MTSRDPQSWCEAVRSAILPTAWLLVTDRKLDGIDYWLPRQDYWRRQQWTELRLQTVGKLQRHRQDSRTRSVSVDVVYVCVCVWPSRLTLWRPLLPYGYSYKASCARPDLWRSNLSVRVPGCQKCKWWLNPVWHRMRFTAVPMWQQWTSKG